MNMNRGGSQVLNLFLCWRWRNAPTIKVFAICVFSRPL